ncbi:CRAL/TRIO domain-containing protein [Cryptosporidium serpentis]
MTSKNENSIFVESEETRITEIIDALKDVGMVEASESESDSMSFTSAIEDSDIECTEGPDSMLTPKNLNDLPLKGPDDSPFKPIADNRLKKHISVNSNQRYNRILEGLGQVEIETSLNPYTMTIECLLYEPQEEDIIEEDLRYIYLNQILSKKEQNCLAKLRRYAKYHKVKFPHIIWIQALRFLYSAQFHLQKALDMMTANLNFRIEELPIYETDVKDDLQIGAIYWHGRDYKCRPMLIVRIDKMDLLEGDINRLQKLLCFCLEFFLRYLQVAGRVENWNVIIDLSGKGFTDLPIQALKSVISLVNTRYRMRLYRMFIVNCPIFLNLLSSALLSTLPGTSARKVRFVDGAYSDELLEMISPYQLEQRYGGKCPDVTENFYPFKFYPCSSNQNIMELDQAELLSKVPLGVIAGFSVEIPPNYDIEKLTWLKFLPNMSFSPLVASKLSNILRKEVKSVTSLQDIFSLSSNINELDN